MRAILTAVVAAIEAAAVALAGLVLVAVPAALLWILTFDLAAQPIEVLSGAIAVWALAHFAPLSIGVTAETALGLGLPAEELTVPLSLPPLGITLLTAALAARMGWRFARRGGSGAAGVLGGAVGFAAVAALALPFAQSLVPQPIWLSAAVAGLVFLVPAGIAFTVRAATGEQEWWAAAARRLRRGLERVVPGGGSLPSLLAETLRVAAAACVGVVGLGALGFAAALTLGYVDITALAQGLQLDPLGAVLVFLVQLALLPVAIIWGISWFAGSGFAIGSGTSVSPFETLLGPLPSLPVLGAVPHGWGEVAALAPALVVLIGLGLGLLAARRAGLRTGSWLAALSAVVCAGALAGLAVAGLGALASGAIGPDRFSVTGPDPWVTGGLVAGELAGGLLLGMCVGRIGVSRMRTALGALGPTAREEADIAADDATGATDASPPRARLWAGRVRDGATGLVGAIGFGAGRGRRDGDGTPTETGEDGSLAALDLSDVVGTDIDDVGAVDGDPDGFETAEFETGEFDASEFETAEIEAESVARAAEADDSDAGADSVDTTDTVDAARPGDASEGTDEMPEASDETREETGTDAQREFDGSDALLRAYSWDAPQDAEEPPPSQKRGWRPPWRSH